MNRRMMSCRQVGKLLQFYLDGEIDDVTAERLAVHLEACRRCGLEHDTYAAVKETLRRRAPAVPEEPVARLRAFSEQLVTGGS